MCVVEGGGMWDCSVLWAQFYYEPIGWVPKGRVEKMEMIKKKKEEYKLCFRFFKKLCLLFYNHSKKE